MLETAARVLILATGCLHDAVQRQELAHYHLHLSRPSLILRPSTDLIVPCPLSSWPKRSCPIGLHPVGAHYWSQKTHLDGRRERPKSGALKASSALTRVLACPALP